MSHWHFIISPYSLRCHTDISLYLPITWLFRICSHWLHWKVKSSLWALAVSNGGVYCKMYLVSHWHVLISSYYLTVSNLLSLTTLKSEEFTLSSGSFKWGGGLLWDVPGVTLTFPYIFLLIACFEWALIDHIEKWRVHSWALAVSNGGVNRQIYPKSENLSLFQFFLISSYYLTVSNGLSLTALKSIELTQCSGSFKWGGPSAFVFPYIFLLVDCFKWVLIGTIEKHRVDSVLWQFQVGGGVNRQIYPKSENLSSRTFRCAHQ